MRIFNPHETADLLPYPELTSSLCEVLAEYEAGRIDSPERMVVPCGDRTGLLLSMPSVSSDLVCHKLLSIYSGNTRSGLPAIQGQVTAFDAANGTPLFCLDGPTVTARRTAAISLIGIRHLTPSDPRSVLIIGTGAQASGHVGALLQTYPDVAIRVRGLSPAEEASFCARMPGGADRVSPASGAHFEPDVVIALTSSKVPVYDEEADPGRLVIGVGAYRLDMVEIGARLIGGSRIFVDDQVGAPAEAGDLAAAGADWSQVSSLASALVAEPDFTKPIFLKSVGCAAWDLAACRAARRRMPPVP